jgi:hypothetical protein
METDSIKKNEIRVLLEKYFNCETTLLEESSLREYFSQPVIDPQFQEYSSLFNYFSKEICELNTSEQKSEVRPEFHLHRHTSVKKVLFRSYSLTAAAALAVFAYFLWPMQQTGVEMMIGGVKVNNEQLAISKTEIQFEKINTMMGLVNERTSPLSKLGDIQKSLSTINSLGKAAADSRK